MWVILFLGFIRTFFCGEGKLLEIDYQEKEIIVEDLVFNPVFTIYLNLNPKSVDLCENRILVTGKNRLELLDMNGRVVQIWELPHVQKGVFVSPTKFLAVNDAGEIFKLYEEGWVEYVFQTPYKFPQDILCKDNYIFITFPMKKKIIKYDCNWESLETYSTQFIPNIIDITFENRLIVADQYQGDIYILENDTFYLFCDTLGTIHSLSVNGNNYMVVSYGLSHIKTFTYQFPVEEEDKNKNEGDEDETDVKFFVNFMSLKLKEKDFAYIKIFDISGRKVYENFIKGPFESSVPYEKILNTQGNYFFEIKTKYKKFKKKIFFIKPMKGRG